MNNSRLIRKASVEKTTCPYCRRQTTVNLPGSYKPVYNDCECCGKTFVAERLAKGFQVMTWEETPCCSDPACRAIEMGGSDEQ